MLLFRPKAYSDECPVSYLARVAEGNGFKNFGHLLHHSGIPIANMESAAGKILNGEIKLKDSLASLGIDFDNSKTIQLNKTFRPKIDTEFVFVQYPRACPNCLDSFGYCKATWSFYPVIACNEHKIMLADMVAPNPKKLSWQRAELNPFHKTDYQPQKASKDVLAFNQYVSLLIMGEDQINTPPSIIEGLGFRESLTLIHLLAHFQARLNNKYFKPRNLDVQSLALRYLSVWKAIHNWPDSFYRLLDKYVGKGENAFVARHFQSIFDHLEHHQTNLGIARIKEEFIRYIEEYRPELKHRIYASPTN